MAIPWPARRKGRDSTVFDSATLHADGEGRTAAPWTVDRSHLHLDSAGIGFNWIGARQWQAQLQLAVPVGSVPAMLGKRQGGRVWLQAVRGF